MSITAASSHAAIWNSATSVLTNSARPPNTETPKANDASNAKAKPTGINIAGSNPFEALSQTSQFALIQAQAAKS
jgi:hypothetical protein